MPSKLASGFANLGDDRALQAIGRNGTGRIARVNAGLFDVLHDAGHDHLLTVGNGVDIHFRGVLDTGVSRKPKPSFLLI